MISNLFLACGLACVHAVVPSSAISSTSFTQYEYCSQYLVDDLLLPFTFYTTFYSEVGYFPTNDRFYYVGQRNSDTLNPNYEVNGDHSIAVTTPTVGVNDSPSSTAHNWRSNFLLEFTFTDGDNLRIQPYMYFGWYTAGLQTFMPNTFLFQSQNNFTRDVYYCVLDTDNNIVRIKELALTSNYYFETQQCNLASSNFHQFLRLPFCFEINGYDTGDPNDYISFTFGACYRPDQTYTDGFNDGYTGGYLTGSRDGYANGYAEALEYFNQHHDWASFTGLLAAIADTPLRMLYSMFNFDLFGTTVTIAILSLLTGIIIIGIVKKFIK